MSWFTRLRAGPTLVFGVFCIMLGAMIGLGTFTFTYAKGTSYFSDDPQACTNCHLMNEEYDAWMHSSHKSVAVCNSCHMPHNPINKWFTKALNGFNHSFAFTTSNFPETILITDRNAQIVQDNCVYCHQELVAQIYGNHEDLDGRRCVSCHANVGHANHPTN